jgi:hypothetical protein
MAVFETVRTMRVRLGLPDTDDINEVIEQALESAAITLASKVRSQDFDRRTVTDKFFTMRALDYGGQITRRRSGDQVGVVGVDMTSASVAKFKLARGHLESITHVRAAATVNGLEDSALYFDLQSTNGKNYVDFDLDRGFMFVHDFTMSNTYVEVKYVAGFATDSGRPGVFTVPATSAWLTEAAALITQIDLADHPLIARQGAAGGDFESGIDRIQKRRQAQLDSIILQHSRYLPMRQGILRDSTETAAP